MKSCLTHLAIASGIRKLSFQDMWNESTKERSTIISPCLFQFPQALRRRYAIGRKGGKGGKEGREATEGAGRRKSRRGTKLKEGAQLSAQPSGSLYNLQRRTSVS